MKYKPNFTDVIVGFVVTALIISLFYLLYDNSKLKSEIENEKRNCDRKTKNYVDFFGCGNDDGLFEENMSSTTNNKREDYLKEESLEYDLYLLGEGKIYKHPK